MPSSGDETVSTRDSYREELLNERVLILNKQGKSPTMVDGQSTCCSSEHEEKIKNQDFVIHETNGYECKDLKREQDKSSLYCNGSERKDVEQDNHAQNTHDTRTEDKNLAQTNQTHENTDVGSKGHLYTPGQGQGFRISQSESHNGEEEEEEGSRCPCEQEESSGDDVSSGDVLDLSEGEDVVGLEAGVHQLSLAKQPVSTCQCGGSVVSTEVPCTVTIETPSTVAKVTSSTVQADVDALVDEITKLELSGSEIRGHGSHKKADPYAGVPLGPRGGVCRAMGTGRKIGVSQQVRRQIQSDQNELSMSSTVKMSGGTVLIKPGPTPTYPHTDVTSTEMYLDFSDLDFDNIQSPQTYRPMQINHRRHLDSEGCSQTSSSPHSVHSGIYPTSPASDYSSMASPGGVSDYSNVASPNQIGYGAAQSNLDYWDNMEASGYDIPVTEKKILNTDHNSQIQEFEEYLKTYQQDYQFSAEDLDNLNLAEDFVKSQHIRSTPPMPSAVPGTNLSAQPNMGSNVLSHATMGARPGLAGMMPVAPPASSSSSFPVTGLLPGLTTAQHGPLPTITAAPAGSMPAVTSAQSNMVLLITSEAHLFKANQKPVRKYAPIAPRPAQPQSEAGSTRQMEKSAIEKPAAATDVTSTSDNDDTSTETTPSEESITSHPHFIKGCRKVANIPLHVLRQIDASGDNCLHMAACQDVYLFFAIMSRLKRENIAKEIINVANGLEQTPLYIAVVTNKPIIVKELISCGADVNKQARDQQNLFKGPIHFAAANGRKWLPILRLLTKETSLDINKSNSEGLPPLHCAILAHRSLVDGEVVDSWPIIHLLLKCGASLKQMDLKSGKSGLHLIVETMDAKLLQKVLFLNLPDMREIVNSKAYNGNTCLHIAAGLPHMRNVDEHREIIRLLLNHGADPTIVNSDNNIPRKLCNNNSKIAEIFTGRSPHKPSSHHQQMSPPSAPSQDKPVGRVNAGLIPMSVPSPKSGQLPPYTAASPRASRTYIPETTVAACLGVTMTTIPSSSAPNTMTHVQQMPLNPTNWHPTATQPAQYM